VKGSREQDRGILELQTSLKDFIHGDKAAAKKHDIAAIKELVLGTKLGIKGDKLLGLPPSD
jgi:hypothetical protein